MAVSKDLLQYFDEHFLEDPALYSSLAQIRTKIISQMRASSMPLISIKAGVYEWIK